MDVIRALKILGLKRGCDMVEVKSTYRKLAMVHHPDKNPNNKVAETKMKQINNAYEICCKYYMNKTKGRKPNQNYGQVQWKTVYYGSTNMMGSSFSIDMDGSGGFTINVTA